MEEQIKFIKDHLNGCKAIFSGKNLKVTDTAIIKLAEIESELKKLRVADVSGSLRFSEREVDFAYLCGVFNTSGIDGLHNEIQRLKELGKEPHDIIEACRKQ
jgi:hypothetical protein